MHDDNYSTINMNINMDNLMNLNEIGNDVGHELENENEFEYNRYIDKCDNYSNLNEKVFQNSNENSYQYTQNQFLNTRNDSNENQNKNN